MNANRVVFMSVAAQADNLGDIEIRRVLYDWVRESSYVTVFVGNMPQAYIREFPTTPQVRFVSNPFLFEVALLRHAMVRRASLVFAPGPELVRKGVRANIKPLANLLNVAIVRLSGGRVLAVGRSYRREAGARGTLQRMLFGLLNLSAVRDDLSAKALGVQADFYPDLAFQGVQVESLGAGNGIRRQKLAVSLRSDRRLDVEQLTTRLRDAMEGGWEIVLVTQVKRDDLFHVQLADTLGCPIVAWGDRTHGEQAMMVREAYKDAAYVLTNRLHGALIGLQMGAVPVIMVDGSDKLSSTLDPWISLPRLTLSRDEALPIRCPVDGDVRRQFDVASARVTRDLRRRVEACLLEDDSSSHRLQPK